MSEDLFRPLDPQEPPAQRSRRAMREAARPDVPGPAPRERPPARDAGRPAPPRRRWPLPLLALLLAGWAACCFADVPGRLGVVPVVLATTSPFVSVAAAAVGAVALRGRRWVSGVLAVAAGLLPWGLVLGYAGADRAPVENGSALRVLVVNAHGGQADAAEIVSAVRANDVDLLVVTELSRTLSHQLTEAQLGQLLVPQWFAVDDDPQAGLGIWSEFDVTDPALVPGTTWPAVRVAVQTRTGPVTLVAGHAAPPVPAGVDAWSRDLTAFTGAVRGRDRTVLAGTFNASPWNAPYRRLLRTGLDDAADVQGRGLRPTWPTWTPLPLVPMDSALVSDDLGVESADTVAITGTDHRALLVGLRIP